MSTPTIFISYNSADRQWAEWIGWHLEEEGCSVILQDWDFRPGSNFVLKMQEAARSCDRTLIVLSDNFLSAEYTQAEWAAAFAQDPTGELGKLLPVRVAECTPDGLLGQIVWVDLVGVAEDQARQKLMDGLEDRGKPAEQPPFPGSSIPDDARTITVRPPHPAKIRVSIARLPTTPHILLGRDDQLAQLTAAWEADHTHVLTIVAPGGVGKTALVNRWLAEMAQEDYRGARRVYGWSFYSQGSGESKNASGEPFIDAALEWLGDPDPTAGSPWQRGERLADLIR